MNSFRTEIHHLLNHFQLGAQVVHTEKWQGVDISSKPEMATYELTHVVLRADCFMETDLNYYRAQISPNLPWADDHFAERVCGAPINPGVEWKNWPYAHSAERFLDADGKFNHNYMERYWPKRAGHMMATETAKDWEEPTGCISWGNIEGIYREYGDLGDLVKQIARDPFTRQAVLPVFFPEDTGAVHGGRVPCSLFYQFLIRQSSLDTTYVIRSCDLKRHFRDDIYLTMRLALWVLEQAAAIEGPHQAYLKQVRPGKFTMLITSLHCFVNDYRELFPDRNRHLMERVHR